METKTALIKSIVPKTAGSGRSYWTVDTDQGTMNCFESDLIPRLIIGANITMNVQRSTDGAFLNIRGILDPTQTNIPQQNSVPISKENVQKQFNNSNDDKTKTFRTSYRKDIFIALLNSKDKWEAKMDFTVKQLMMMSIELEKQAWGDLKNETL